MAKCVDFVVKSFAAVLIEIALLYDFCKTLVNFSGVKGCTKDLEASIAVVVHKVGLIGGL